MKGAIFGLYDYAVGDDVATLLSLAGGLTSLADSAKISVHTAAGETKQLNFFSVFFGCTCW